MEKRRTFLLVTLILCLLGLFTLPLFLTFGLMVMGENISFLSVYNEMTYTIIHNVVGISLSGIITLISFFGFIVLVVLLALSFVFFLLTSKKPKLAKLSIIFTGLTMLATLLIVGSLILVTTVEFWLEFAFYLVYTMEPISSYSSYYYSSDTYLNLTFAINRCVRGGMMGTAVPLMSVTLLFPLVTYILVLVTLKKKKPAKQEEPVEEVK